MFCLTILIIIIVIVVVIIIIKDIEVKAMSIIISGASIKGK